MSRTDIEALESVHDATLQRSTFKKYTIIRCIFLWHMLPKLWHTNNLRPTSWTNDNKFIHALVRSEDGVLNSNHPRDTNNLVKKIIYIYIYIRRGKKKERKRKLQCKAFRW